MVIDMEASYTLRGRTSSRDMPLTCDAKLLTADRLEIYERCDRVPPFLPILRLGKFDETEKLEDRWSVYRR